jgi:hypothetical protein
MDVVTYALLNKKIAGMMPNYKGTVTDVDDLPATADEGDMYVVTSVGNIHYSYQNGEWVAIDPPIATNSQIDGLYS